MPPNPVHTQTSLLDAAERLFAEHGYDGVSLRAVAAEAASQLALIHYHYGSKADLYRAVWLRRYQAIPGIRAERLSRLDFTKPRAELVRDIVLLFLMPMELFLDAATRNFVVILFRELADPKEAERGIVSELLDPSVSPIFAALRRFLPDLSPEALAWGYQAMAGVAMNHVVDVDRATRLSGGAVKSGDYRSAFPHLVDFIVGGWLRLASAASQQHREGDCYV